MTKYCPPKFQITSFHCPFCGVYSHQNWYPVAFNYGRGRGYSEQHADEIVIATCSHCKKYSLWVKKQMIVPDGGSSPLPHPEMPPEIIGEFEEARSIVGKSPRGAAALLRLAIQKLMPVLGEKGKNIGSDIGNLVEKGLPIQLQQALDTVRVIGNESVHPGTIDLNDNPHAAQSLFAIVNMIVDRMIAEPKRLNAIYNGLPPTKLAAIEQRDGK